MENSINHDIIFFPEIIITTRVVYMKKHQSLVNQIKEESKKIDCSTYAQKRNGLWEVKGQIWVPLACRMEALR